MTSRHVLVRVPTRGLKEPRLRFDRTAIGFVERLQSALSDAVPNGKTAVVTITAPIRQDLKTSLMLQDRIDRLLTSGRLRLTTTIWGNRSQVHLLNGAGHRTARLIGFVHNPEPVPSVLIDAVRALLAAVDSKKRSGTCPLVIDNRDGLAPVETIRQGCLALQAQREFTEILIAEGDGVTSNL